MNKGPTKKDKEKLRKFSATRQWYEPAKGTMITIKKSKVAWVVNKLKEAWDM